MRRMKVVLSACLVAGLIMVWGMQFATSAPGPSARNSTAAGGAAPAVKPNTVPIHTAPVRTYFASNNANLALSAGTPAALGSPISVSCPGTTGKCKIEIDNSLQVGGNSTAGNYAAIWEVRDGSVVSAPGGPYSEVPSDGGFSTMSFTENFSGVLHGTRSIQPTVVASSGSMTAYNYTIVIRVYKP